MSDTTNDQNAHPANDLTHGGQDSSNSDADTASGGAPEEPGEKSDDSTDEKEGDR